MNGHSIQLTQEIFEAFQKLFHDYFARLPNLSIKFCSYLANFPCLQQVEAAGCERQVTVCEVCDVLKLIDCKQSRKLEGQPYKVCIWGCHEYLYSFRGICSINNLLEDWSLSRSTKDGSNCWGSEGGMFEMMTIIITMSHC